MPTIRQRGKKFNAQVRIKEGGVIVHQESQTWDTRKQALAWGLNLEATIKKNGPEVRVAGKVTVLDLLDKVEAIKRKVKPLSPGMKHSFSALASAPFSARSVTKLAAADISRWAVSERERGLAPATIMHHLMVLSSCMGSAKALVGVAVDATVVSAAIKALKKENICGPSESRFRRISDAEMEQIILLHRTRVATVPLDIYVRLAVALPRRREELLTMRWCDYDGRTVTLYDTKNPSKPRTEVVPVPPNAKAIIDRLPRDHDRIMPYKVESMSASFQRAVRALGMADIRLHDLRHEGISRLFEAGLDIPEVSLISGHTSWASLKRYTHMQTDRILEKLNASRQRTQETPA